MFFLLSLRVLHVLVLHSLRSTKKMIPFVHRIHKKIPNLEYAPFSPSQQSKNDERERNGNNNNSKKKKYLSSWKILFIFSYVTSVKEDIDWIALGISFNAHTNTYKHRIQFSSVAGWSKVEKTTIDWDETFGKFFHKTIQHHHIINMMIIIVVIIISLMQHKISRYLNGK